MCNLVTPVAGVEHPLREIQDYLEQNDDEKDHKYCNACYLMEHKYTPKSLNSKVLSLIVNFP